MKLLTQFLIPRLLFKTEAFCFFEVQSAHFSRHLILQEQQSHLKYVSSEGSIYCLFLSFPQCWLLWPGGRRESLLRYSLEYNTSFHAVFTHSSRTQSLFFSVLFLVSSVQDKACAYKGCPRSGPLRAN